MAISKTLTSKLLNPTTTRTLILRLFTTDPFSRLTSPHSRLFSPRPPLFLSSPPWILSQYATPLWSRGEELDLKLKLNRKAVVEVGDGRVVRGGNEGGFVGECVWNLPNFISISRMVSGPVIGWMIINEWYFSSFISLGISGMTDWLDGYAARKMNINSVLGSYLDPLADKVLIVCVALAMVKKDLLHPWLVVLVVLRDIGLVSGAVYKRASSLGWKWKSWSDFVSLNTTCPEKLKPLFISKVNTVLQLSLVAGALLQPEFGTEETELYITYLSWIVGSTTVASSAAYGVQHVRRKAVAASVQ